MVIGEEYAEDKFHLSTICLGKQFVSDLWDRERYEERQRWGGVGETQKRRGLEGKAALKSWHFESGRKKE